MLAASFISNQWFADVAAGLIVAAIIGTPALLIRWLKKQLRAIMTEVKPNGGDSSRLGDRMLRTEESTFRTERKVDEMVIAVSTQKGHTDAVEAEVFTRIGKLETKAEAAIRAPQHTDA